MGSPGVGSVRSGGPTAGRRKLGALRAGRALAALAVVAHHAAGHGTSEATPTPPAPGAVLGHGGSGVNFFFVLSGVIIPHTTVGRVGDADGLVRYVRHRTTRIYLPDWPIGLGLAALYVRTPGFGGSGREWSWLEGVTPLPFGQGTALAVAWTLKHEVMFYAIVGLGLLLGRPLALLGAWSAVIVAAMILMPRLAGVADDWPDVLLAPINLEFGMGLRPPCGSGPSGPQAPRSMRLA